MRFARMTIVSVAIAAAIGAAVLGGVAHAQGVKATINDPAGPLPDPTHVPIVLPKDIKWTGQEGSQSPHMLGYSFIGGLVAIGAALTPERENPDTPTAA